MAVEGLATVFYRRFNGWADPRYPQGHWFATLTVQGDASGGNLLGRLLFSLATETALNTRMYSLEQFNLASNSSTTEAGRLTVENLDGRILGQPMVQQTLLQVTAEITGATMSPADLRGLQGLFLGSQRLPATQSALTFVMDNINNRDWVVQAGGYWWGQRSVLADGGPQRPPRGLFRN